MSRSSVVWEFFDVSAVDESKAKCKLCKSLISRGGKGTATYNTSNLMKHLDKTHSEQWAAAKSARSSAKSSQPASQTSAGQLRIATAFEAQTPWSFDDERSRRIHRVIGEMMAIDNESFHFVNRKGL